MNRTYFVRLFDPKQDICGSHSQVISSLTMADAVVVELHENRVDLIASLSSWKRENDNWVCFSVCTGRCSDTDEFFACVHIHESNRYVDVPCRESDYDALRAFVRSLPGYEA